MKLKITAPDYNVELEPITCRRGLLDIEIAGATLKEAIRNSFKLAEAQEMHQLTINIQGNLWPSPFLADLLLNSERELLVVSENKTILAWVSENGEMPEECGKVTIDSDSVYIQFPWDILRVNENILGALQENIIEGTISRNANIDGHIVIGEGSVLLPGAYIEGNVIIGRNCKIGPNCYIRANTSIGDDCHVGQAVEIKNSILMNNVSAGHLTYLGDSIICPKANFGAGTITANFRHDGKNHRSMVNGDLLDTGRRKLGAMIGDNVHTGTHTSIYPGRKIWPDLWTLPGDVVRKDIMS